MHFRKEQHAMITNDIYLSQIVSDYIDHGFAPIPIHYKSKQPVNKGWPGLRISKNDIGEYFSGELINIGILTGQPSQGLVDIDIDDPEFTVSGMDKVSSAN